MSCIRRPSSRAALRRGFGAAVPIAFALAGLLALPVAAASFVKVVATGDAAPGLPAGTVFDEFASDSLNDAGGIVFSAFVSGPGITPDDDQVIYRAPFASPLVPLVRQGDPAAGAAPGVVYGIPGPATQNAAGDFAFSPHLSDGVDTWGAIYVSGGTLFAQEGDPVPGVAGATWSGSTHLVTPHTDASGRQAFRASLGGSNPGSSMWGPDALGDPTLVAFEQDAAPDLEAGATFGAMLLDPLHNDTGRMAFTSTLGGTAAGESALWLRDAGAAAGNLVRGSDSSVALGIGESVGALTALDLNDAGTVVFHSLIEGALVSDADDGALWRSGGGAPELLVREGDAAPGAAGGTTFSGLLSGSLAETGAIAILTELTATLGGTSDAIYLLDESEALNLVLETGDAAPGLAGLSIDALPVDPQIDADGNFIFRADVAGGAVTAADDGVLYYYDTLTDSLRVVVREGDELELEPGDSRTIAELLGSELNDGGQISIHVSFVGGGQGIFLAAIPEPGTAVLLALGLSGIGAARRRARRNRR